MILLPVSGALDEESNVTIQDIPLLYRVRYNTKYDYWSFSLSDVNGSSIIEGVKIQTGGILSQPYMSDSRLPLGQFMCISTETVPTLVPNKSQLGSTALLVFFSNEELFNG